MARHPHNGAAHPHLLLPCLIATLGGNTVAVYSRLRLPPDSEFATDREQVDAVFVTNAALNFAHLRRIADLAMTHRLPSFCEAREFAEVGGLISYGYGIADDFRNAAAYVKKILDGAKPADLPWGQPTKLELVINLKTAKALGITIPHSLLLRADEVIQ